MEWGKLSVWLLGRRFIWFGHSGDAWSCLVTREMLYLVQLLGRRLIWFGHSGDAWSDLTPSGGVRGCVMTIFKTLSGFNYSGDVVWFDPLGRRGVPVTSLGRRNQTLTWLSWNYIFNNFKLNLVYVPFYQMILRFRKLVTLVNFSQE